jgi:hypothetical protein
MPNYVEVAKTSLNLSADRLSTSASFDAVIYKPGAGGYMHDMWKLTLKLRFRMQQAYPSPTVKDLDGHEFAIKPWTATEWQVFVKGAKTQADLWNKRFWLKPPSKVKDYDAPLMGSSSLGYFRPYFACELEVDFNANVSDAHRTINVYNLDLSKIKPKDQDSDVFRSSALIYDSLDTVPWATKYKDEYGNPIMHYTIAHEIGHAIGQPHIGVMRRTPLCELDMFLSDVGLNDEGQNSDSCYASDQPSLAKNIMGGGGTFSDDNAISWLWAIRFLRGNPIEDNWQLVKNPTSVGEPVKY